jgi:uncharacterized protein
MRWTPGGPSRHVEDRRGQRGPAMAGLGLGGTAIVLILGLIFGRDFLGEGGPAGGAAGGEVAIEETAEERELVQFVTYVLDDAQAVWTELLPGYRPATLVLFRDATQTACGVGQSAMGPFYCPADEKVYVDLSFYDALRSRFGAPGDFAQAYVIAHELGHHVQQLTGTAGDVRRAQQSDRRNANAYSVALELQADCYAGVWAHSAARRDKLEPGDVEEGLGAAAAVGDDRLQQQAGGRVQVESFTHGSSAQRMEWFRRGMQSGDPRACETLGR